MSPKISCAMISWNEASTIDLTLKSVAGFADEVILVDTGSWDGTQKIAREWMHKLNLSGQVTQVKIVRLGEARMKTLSLCSHEWMLMQDSDLALSAGLKQEIKRHMNKYKKHSMGIKSINLMGDYEHYFSNLPFMAHHQILIKKGTVTKLRKALDRPSFGSPKVNAKCFAVNLSRVRPAWRCWYRGEPFDRQYYRKDGKRRPPPESNRQWRWQRTRKYHSIREYTEAEEGYTLEDVKRIAPTWFLRQLQIEAKPLKKEWWASLAEVVKAEIKSPRYKLIYEKGRIIGRRPEL